MKKLLLILLTIATLFAGDARLNNYPQAQEWEKVADTESYAAYNLGHTYHTKIKDYEKAIQWYKKAYSLDKKNTDAANNLGYLYEDLKQNVDAIQWYKIANKNGDADSAINIALLYKKAYEKGNMGGQTV